MSEPFVPADPEHCPLSNPDYALFLAGMNTVGVFLPNDEVNRLYDEWKNR